MPEGDTVAWTARRLTSALAGQVVTRSDLRVPRHATTDLTGRTSGAVLTYGKHLFHRFDDGLTLHSHLKMEGRWSVLSPPHALPGREQPQANAAVRRAEASHTTRALLYTPTALAVGSKLGLLDVIATSAEADITARLGADILGTDWDGAGEARTVTTLRAKPERLIGEALLDQTSVAGLGTFWISEMLFIHRILPWTPVGRIDADTLTAVLADARARMMRNAATGIQRSTGGSAPAAMKYVHARSGLPCVRCGDTIRIAMTGPAGRERTRFSCPTCQGGHAPGDDGRAQRPLNESRDGGYRAGSRSAARPVR